MAEKPLLRHFQLQVQYKPSFLFWNVRGALAERWGHGPLFDVVGDQAGQITLSKGSNNIPETDFVAAIAGLAVSSFVWELSPESYAGILCLMP
jgi:hypothetical protein